MGGYIRFCFKEREKETDEGFNVFTTDFEAYTARIRRRHAVNEKKIEEFSRSS